MRKPEDELPDAAFAPPPEAGHDRVLELDPEWVAARAAKQAEAAKPPPRAPIAGVVIAVLLIAAVTAVVIWLVKR
jgi:hypothetical protein